MKRIAEAFRAARKIEFVLLAVFIAVLIVVVMDQGLLTAAGGSDTEIRLERLLSRINGAGDIDVMLSGEEGNYSGCVVIADGAEDLRVTLKIQQAIHAALDIPAENIEIIASGG